jgi:hypothetical protein
MKIHLLSYFLLPVFKPFRNLDLLIQDEHKVRRSTIIFLFLGIIYTISVQLAYMQGFGAVIQPFLNIPAQDYYAWQRFFQIPLFFITTILFAGIVRLLSATTGGRGSFENVYSILCVCQTFPMFLTMWIPETINFIFYPGQHIYPEWFNIGRQISGIIWPLVLVTIGIRKSEQIKWHWSILFMLVASVPMVALMVIFIR